MNVMFEGRFRNRAVVEYYVDNLQKALGIKRLQRPLTIIFKSKLDGAYGLCDGDVNYAEIEIATKGLTFIRQMTTLAHEMVHARQFIRGELKLQGAWKWKGRNAENYAYINQPWEKEAYRLERKLFLNCFPIDEEIR